MTQPTREGYEKACVQMLAAAMAFREVFPGAELVFRGLGAPAEAFVIAALEPSMIKRVAGNDVTRALLERLDAVSEHKASIAQADYVIEQVFGIKRAITGSPTDKPDPERGEFAMPVSACPHCGKMLDCSTETMESRRPPAPGDMSVCIYCAAALVYAEGMQLRAATPQERADAGRPLKAAMAAVKKLRAAERRKRN